MAITISGRPKKRGKKRTLAEYVQPSQTQGIPDEGQDQEKVEAPQDEEGSHQSSKSFSHSPRSKAGSGKKVDDTAQSILVQFDSGDLGLDHDSRNTSIQAIASEVSQLSPRYQAETTPSQQGLDRDVQQESDENIHKDGETHLPYSSKDQEEYDLKQPNTGKDINEDEGSLKQSDLIEPVSSASAPTGVVVEYDSPIAGQDLQDGDIPGEEKTSLESVDERAPKLPHNAQVG